MKQGIDVSMFIPECRIQNYNPDFVIIRSGEGALRDTKTEFYAAQCRDAGIPYGYYHVLRLGSNTLEENIRSLEDAIKKSGRPSMGVWCDVETEDAFQDPEIRKFCKHFEEKGIYSGIYSGINQFRSGRINLPEFDKWIAFYGPDTGDINDFTPADLNIIQGIGSIWQYHGGSANPDLNLCFLDDLSIYNGNPGISEIENLKSLISTLKKLVDEIERRIEKL